MGPTEKFQSNDHVISWKQNFRSGVCATSLMYVFLKLKSQEIFGWINSPKLSFDNTARKGCARPVCYGGRILYLFTAKYILEIGLVLWIT